MTRVVSPSDLRPAFGPPPVRELGDPPEPEAFEAFEPAEIAPGNAKGEPLPPLEGNKPPPAFANVEVPDELEPPARPVVEYLDPAPVILPLRYPVRIDGVGIVRELAIHGPTLWDIQDWAAGRLRTNWELMARMVGIDPVALGALRWVDIETLAEIAATMLPDAMRNAIEAGKAVWERKPLD